MIDFTQIFAQVVANLTQNIIWIILIIYGINKVSRSLKDGVSSLAKNMPVWIEGYFKAKLEAEGITRAVNSRKKIQ